MKNYGFRKRRYFHTSAYIFLIIDIAPIKQCAKEEENLAVPRHRDKLDLGLFQTLSKHWIGKEIIEKNPSKAIKSAHILKSFLSCLDTISDLMVAVTLIEEKEFGWALSVMLVDYLPSWQVLLHGIKSPAWQELNNLKEKVLACVMLAFSPFASILFTLRLLWGYSDTPDDLFNFHHQNQRVSELITSSVESPLQLVLMMLLVAYGKLPMPWNETSTIQDDLGNSVSLGAFPGMFSLIMSVLSLIISSLDVAECTNWKDRFVFGSYAFCNGLFRIGSIVMLIALFRFWTLRIFIPCLFFASLTAIIKIDPDDRKNFSALTTFLVGLFLPVAVSAEPQKAQYVRKLETDYEKTIENRMFISGRISLFTSPIILLFDLALFLLLFFKKGFRVNSELVWDVNDTKEIAIKVLYLFLLPSGLAAITSSYILSTRSTRKTVPLVLGMLSTAVLLLGIVTPVHVWPGNDLTV